MWRTEPNFTKAQLGAISIPVTISDGRHDEIIKIEHTREIAASIKGARVEIIAGASHFAMLQTVTDFNRALEEFLART
jgi:pimeloyl-ACP methyl ester carboxylesterase